MSDSEDKPIEKTKYTVRPPIKSNKKQTPSRQRAQKARHEGFRDIKNKEFTAKQDALIKAKMQPLFELEKLSSLGSLVPVARTVPIPVSTRSIGFSLYETVRGAFGINATTAITRPNLLAVYRHLHAKIAAKWMSSPAAVIDRQLFVIPSVAETLRMTLNLDAWMPMLIARYHDSIGQISLQNGNSYYPVLPLLPTVQNVIIPRPDAVCINNLRVVVEALANPATPLAVRQGFFQNNPIPGAHWQNDVLMNPDEIMPAVYDVPQAMADANIALQFFSDIQKKAPKLISMVTSEAKGSNALLATIELNAPAGIPSMPNIEVLGVPQPVGPWVQQHPLPVMEGQAYYDDQLSVLEVMEASLALFGEWLPIAHARTGLMTRRDPGVKCQQLKVSRTDALAVLLGFVP